MAAAERNALALSTNEVRAIRSLVVVYDPIWISKCKKLDYGTSSSILLHKYIGCFDVLFLEILRSSSEIHVIQDY